jgi:hypothetical protein
MNQNPIFNDIDCPLSCEFFQTNMQIRKIETPKK